MDWTVASLRKYMLSALAVLQSYEENYNSFYKTVLLLVRLSSKD